MSELFYPSRLLTHPIFIFWHTWTAPDVAHQRRFRAIILRQLFLLQASRLADLAQAIYISVPGSGLHLLPDGFRRRDTVHLSLYEQSQHEGHTLTLLKDLVDTKAIPEGASVLYFHARGASRVDDSHSQQCSDDWTQMMEYFCIQRWRFAVELLANHYTCGCEMWPHLDASNGRIDFEYPREFWHYSGNFWWSQADYIRDFLAKPELYFTDNFMTDRARCEDWILSSVGQLTLPTEHKVLHYTGEKYKQGSIHSYCDRYPASYYLGGSETPRAPVS